MIGPPLVDEEHVVLADASGHVAGTAPKRSVHHDHTPLHHAFSCHVVDPSGRVLLTRRAASKRTWPSVWSNACCGHPQLGETLREAVVRRLDQELGLTPRRLAVAIPDFAYRATMDDGTIEHELCPVLVAEVDGEPHLNPAEVDAVDWVDWTALRRRASLDPRSLSPWSVLQIEGLAELGSSPLRWLDDGHDGDPLDVPIGGPVATDRLAGGASSALGVERDAVERRLRRFVRQQASLLTALDVEVCDITDAVVGLVERGGKRLRPAFVHWGHAATGADPDERVVTAAAAMELLHTFALLHDDVMDRSATRRGAPAAHVTLARERPGDGSASEAAWFGTSAAILAGDLAYVWSDELFGSIGAGPTADRARAVFHQLRSEVIAGQYLDLRISAVSEPTEQAARRVALLKSARYTVTRPLQLGAALGNASADVQRTLGLYGDAVGTAFQLRDDVLGVFGDPGRTGKSCLDDLREGKRTLLVVRALSLGDADQQSAVRAALGDPDLDEPTASACRAAIAASGALASVEVLIAERHAAAQRAIRDLDPPVRDALASLAAFAAHRCA
ncbi:MAG: isopentenyl-diphosphate Delta-isomerase [Acidimicrobiia bacterium]|nr:isopentenyl-diphosphate Delta-isomerase [Acidimicrobiia bacterium]